MNLHTLEDKAFSQTCTPSDLTCTCQCLKEDDKQRIGLVWIIKLKLFEVRQVKRGHAQTGREKREEGGVKSSHYI